MMTFEKIKEIVGNCKFTPWDIVVKYYPENNRRLYLQIHSKNGVDNVTGNRYAWSGRKWSLSLHMTETEIVKTALKAVLAAMEHETLEQFTYKGVTVFDPHISIDALLRIREETRLDGRQ